MKRGQKRTETQGGPTGRSVLGEAGPGRWRSAASLIPIFIRCFSEFVGSTSAFDSWHMTPCFDGNLCWGRSQLLVCLRGSGWLRG